MDDNSENARGPYLQYLSDSSTFNATRTTKYRWSKKVKLTSKREESYPEERNLTKSCIDFSSTSSQRNEVVLSSSTLSFFSDDFKSPELNYSNGKLEMNSFSHSGDKFETKRVTELMSMRVTIRPY